jgi:iron complex outermembrane receptor protein
MKYSLLCLLALAAIPAAAQKKNADSSRVYTAPSLTVTSTTASSGKSPTTFSEYNQNELREKVHTQDLTVALSEMTSLFSVSQNGNNIGYNSLSLRGFDQRRIAVMINGVPQNDPEDHNVYWINFPDLASSASRIQVQRGAGLMNYGAAAMAGSVNVQTGGEAGRRFIRMGSFLGFQQFAKNGGDQQDTWAPTVSKFSMELSSGLIDNKYSISGRLTRINSAGYRDQSWAELNSFYFSGIRYDENLTTQINVYGGPIYDGLAYTGLPKAWALDARRQRANLNAWAYDSTGTALSYTVARRPQEVENFSQPHYEMLNDWYISPAISIKSTLFYYTGDGFFDYDASWADAATLRLTPEYGFADGAEPRNTIFRGFVGNKHGGWVPRIVYNHQDGTLTAGAEIRIHRSEHWGKIAYAENLPAGYDPDYKIYQYNGVRNIFSAFIREQWKASSDLLITAEAQVVHHVYGIENEKAGNKFLSYFNQDGSIAGNGGRLFTVPYVFFNPRIGANYTIDDHSAVYASAAFTSREPRMRNFYAASDSYFGATPLFEQKRLANGSTGYNFEAPLVKPEKMLNLELGWNYRQPNYTLAFTAYAMEFFDELVKSGRLDIFGVPIDGNAPRTRHLGLEFTGNTLLPLGNGYNLELSGNATWSYNRLTDFTYYTGQGQAISLNNNEIAGFPSLMGGMRAGIRSENLFISLTARHLGGFRTDNFGEMLRTNQALIEDLRNSFNGYYTDNQVDAYTVFGMDIFYEFRNFMDAVPLIRLRAQATNLFDTIYASGGEGKEFFPGQRRMITFGIETEL